MRERNLSESSYPRVVVIHKLGLAIKWVINQNINLIKNNYLFLI